MEVAEFGGKGGRVMITCFASPFGPCLLVFTLEALPANFPFLKRNLRLLICRGCLQMMSVTLRAGGEYVL